MRANPCSSPGIYGNSVHFLLHFSAHMEAGLSYATNQHHRLNSIEVQSHPSPGPCKSMAVLMGLIRAGVELRRPRWVSAVSEGVQDSAADSADFPVPHTDLILPRQFGHLSTLSPLSPALGNLSAVWWGNLPLAAIMAL